MVKSKIIYILYLQIGQDFGDDCHEGESDDDRTESGEETESEVDEENDASNEEEWTSSNDAKSDCSDNDEVDVQATAEAALRKLVPCNLEEFEKVLFYLIFFSFSFCLLRRVLGQLRKYRSSGIYYLIGKINNHLSYQLSIA